MMRNVSMGIRAAAAALVAFVLVTGAAQAQDSLIVKQSAHSVGETLDRLASAAEEKGLKVFNRVDHAAGAQGAGLDLRPTQTLVIGNPNAGTPLMQSDQRLALSLPLRVAAWQDEDDTVWVGYWSPKVFAVQYGISDQAERLANMAAALDGLTDAAIAE
jgi:uncharacterized protein (DUF302 family)